MAIHKKYKELTISFNKKNKDAIFNILYLNEINNLLEDNNSVKSYLHEDESKKFNNIKKSLLSKSLVKIKDISVKTFENEDWSAIWKKSIQPVFIKNKIIIYPSWLKMEIIKFDDRILIQIDPKMSFGTGHNETTQLVLEQMCDFITPVDKRLLDFGSGTGILAIAGIKLGIKEAIGIDIDEDSIRDSKLYIKLNHAADKIKLYKKNISEIKEKNFDVICANILSSVIKENIDFIFKKLKPDGKIFLSGILKEEESMMVDFLLKKSFKIIEVKNKAEWIGIYARRI